VGGERDIPLQQEAQGALARDVRAGQEAHRPPHRHPQRLQRRHRGRRRDKGDLLLPRRNPALGRRRLHRSDRQVRQPLRRPPRARRGNGPRVPERGRGGRAQLRQRRRRAPRRCHAGHLADDRR
jgi:hypothetical protein